jgi:hypothetical protein
VTGGGRAVLGLVIGAFVAACAALFLVARGCEDSPDGAKTARSESAQGESHDARVHERAARPGPVAGPSVDSAGAGEPEPAAEPREPLVTDAEFVREVPLEGAPTGWATLEVEVLDAEGAPSVGDQVRAVPVGVRLDEDVWLIGSEVPHGVSDRLGVVRLSGVAATERYEIHTIGLPWSFGRAPVRASGSGRLTIREPRRDAVTVVLDGESGGRTLHVSFATTADADLGDGMFVRGTGRATGEFALSASNATVVTELPSAIEWDVKVTDGWLAEPERIRPPATVRVRRDDRPELTIVCELVPDPKRPYPAGARAGAREIRFVSDAGDEATARIGLVRSMEPGDVDTDAAGTDLADADVDRTPSDRPPTVLAVLAVRTRRGKVSWSGAAVESGTLEYDLDRSAETKCSIRIATGPPEPRTEFRVLVERAPEIESDEVACAWASFRSHGELMSLEYGALPVGSEVSVARPGAWLFVLPRRDRGLVAGPVRCEPGGSQHLVLRRGGWIEVACDGAPDDTGQVDVVRADEMPMLVGAPRRECEPVGRCTLAKPGGGGRRSLGPFEPGVVVLDVLVGRVRWKRYEVTVRPGETTRLAVGPFGGSPR